MSLPVSERGVRLLGRRARSRNTKSRHSAYTDLDRGTLPRLTLGVTMSDFEPQPTGGVSRRTVTKAMAWAVPAIAIAAPAPAFAASGPPPQITVLAACKQPGDSCDNKWGFIKGYTFVVKFTNVESQPIYIYTGATGTLAPVFDVTSSVPFTYVSARLFDPALQNSPTGPIGAAVGTEVQIAANSSIYVIINAGTNDNSANTSAVGDLFLAWGHTATPGADPDHPYTPVPTGTNTPGSGWFGGTFNFASTNPCSNCFPTVNV